MDQQEGQPFAQYYMQLQIQADECAFDQEADPRKRNLRNKLICGIQDESLRVHRFRDLT